MPFTGASILIFILIHLVNFKFADHSGPLGLYGVVETHFQNIGWVVYYIFSMALLAMHVSHGVQSALQTYGLNHPNFNCCFKKISFGFAALIFVGFSSFPIYFFFIKG